MNDPFESLPGITLKSIDWYKAYFQQRIDTELSELAYLTRKERRALERSHWKTFGNFYACYTDKKWLSEQSEKVQMMSDTVHGCLSLSATCTNILMWSHYSSDHKGFVLGFDPNHEFFGQSVNPVIYSHERPKINPFEARHDGKLFYTKSEDWRYEEEHRKYIEFVVPEPLENGNQLLPYAEINGQRTTNTEMRLVALPPDSIKCVIVGWKSNDSLYKQIVSALAFHGLSKVPVFKALPSLTEYKMIIANS